MLLKGSSLLFHLKIRATACYRAINMGKRLSVKKQKTRSDHATAYKNGTTPKKHKVAAERSRKAKLKKALPAY